MHSSRITLRASLLAGGSLVTILSAAAPSSAQTAEGNAASQIQTIEVIGERNDYKADAPSVTKLTQPLLDTPQSITTISGELMDDRGVTTLSDALRNVPGISLGAGEFSWQGTNLTLRGFSARNDMYLDGMHDLGNYYRDPFDLEEVQVLEGPSSMLFGRGSTGGVINQVSKSPTLTPLLSGDLSFGTDNTRRMTADINQPLPELGEGTAVRLALMGNDSQVAGRDVGENRRYGFAPSLALGLGTPTRITFSYLHQTEADIPDYGIPWYQGMPAPVARNNFYGFKNDHLNTNTDILTAKIEHDFSDTLTVRSQLRYSDYYRDFRISEPVVAPAAAGTPLAALLINRNEWTGFSRETFLQDQTDLTAKFTTGGFEHTLVTGFEVGPESSTPEFDNSIGVPQNNLLAPNENQAFSGTTYPRLIANTQAMTFGIYVIDTVKLDDQWEITGGIRWDRFQADYKATSYSQPPAALRVVTSMNSFDEVDQMPSYRAGIVYKPAANGSIYFDYGTSFDPSAEDLSQITSGRSLAISYEGLPPEKNRDFEIGTKWDVMDAKLSLRGALFREEKYNARVPNPANPQFNILGGDQQVDGLDVEVVGHLTDQWQISGGYTYLHSQVIKSAPGGPAVGIPLANVAKHNVTLWTEYRLPYGIEIGGGMTYLSKRVGQNTPPVEVAPGYVSFDAMAKYHVTQQLGLQVNLYNLTDKYYFDQIHTFHIVPGAGRSALFTASYKY